MSLAAVSRLAAAGMAVLAMFVGASAGRAERGLAPSQVVFAPAPANAERGLAPSQVVFAPAPANAERGLPPSQAVFAPAPANDSLRSPARPQLEVGASVRPDAQQGMDIYRARCANCHGPLGRGGGELADRLPFPPPDFSDERFARALVPLEAWAIVGTGRVDRGMPPFADSLTDQERWDALFAAMSFYYHPERLARGKRTWDAACVQCHVDRTAVAEWGPRSQGAAASGAGPAALAVSEADWLEAARPGPDEHQAPELAGLDDDEWWAALDYARGALFQPLPFTQLRLDGSVAVRVVLAPETEGQPATPRTDVAVQVIPFVHAIPAAPITATTNAAGEFTLDGLVAGEGSVYALTTTVDGVEYTEVLDAARANPASALTVELETFAVASSAPLFIESASVLVSPDPQAGVLRYVEIWHVQNPTRVAMVPEPGAHSLRFDVPAGAQGIRFADVRMQRSAHLHDGVLTTAMPLVPGVTEVVFEYEAPYSGTTVRVVRTLPAPVESLRLAVIGEDIEIAGDGWVDGRQDDVAGRALASARQSGGVAGSVVEAVVSGLPAARPVAGMAVPAPAAPMSQLALARTVVVMLALAAGAAALYPRFGWARAGQRRRRHLQAKSHRLMAQLLELDQAHVAGTIGVERYARDRSRLVARLLTMEDAGTDLTAQAVASHDADGAVGTDQAES